MIIINDEFGQISNAINENILATKRGLEQDNQAVKESVQTVSVVEGGNLTARITANPRNPQLIELKNVLNKLLDVLQARVGSDMNAIHKIFEEYKSLDFRNKLENASGSVELTTNALGDEIVKMLKQSSELYVNYLNSLFFIEFRFSSKFLKLFSKSFFISIKKGLLKVVIR